MTPSPQRIVVKVGSSLLADTRTLILRYAFVHGLLEDVADLRSRGCEVVIASSGAVALGLNMMGLKPGEVTLLDKQAAAACGQPLLMSAYKQIGLTHGLEFAQILMTGDDVKISERFNNMRNTINRLLKGQVIPIVNENDTVTTEELRVGDNDQLSARLANIVDADELVILTNVEGLLSAAPGEKSSKLIERLDEPEAFGLADASVSSLGTGGMATKLKAAAIAKASKCATRIGLGVLERPVSSLLRGERKHTYCPGR